METAVFAKGAAYCAADRLRLQTSYPYAMICEGRLKSTVTMEVLHKGQDTAVTLAAAGDSWRDRRTRRKDGRGQAGKTADTPERRQIGTPERRQKGKKDD